jgi:hypothetical protein
MSKCGNSDRSDTGGKKQRITVMPEEKLDVIRRYECNKCMVDIVSAAVIPTLTLRTIRKLANKIKEICKSAIRMMTNKMTQIRAPIMGAIRKDAGSVD